MGIKQTIYQALQKVIETFESTVPQDYTDFPVCRYYLVTTTPSLSGDDRLIHKNHRYQVDIFTLDNDPNLLLSVENALFSTDLSIRLINSTQSIEDDGVYRTMYLLNIQE